MASIERTAGACAIAAPVLLLAADVMQLMPAFAFEWTLVMWLAFATFIPAVLAIGLMAEKVSPTLGWLGLLLSFIGAVAGASMQIYFRVAAVMEAGGEQTALQAMQPPSPLFISIVPLGLFFPVGLVLTAIALAREPARRLDAGLLAAGAIAFPIGHAIGIAPASLGADLILLAAFARLGWGLWKTP
jgi:hypothetical protein